MGIGKRLGLNRVVILCTGRSMNARLAKPGSLFTPNGQPPNP